MSLSKKIQLLDELEKKKAELKSLIESNKLLGKTSDHIDNMIIYSLINANSRKILELSLLETDKYAWEAFLTRIKDPKELKLRNIKKTLNKVEEIIKKVKL